MVLAATGMEDFSEDVMLRAPKVGEEAEVGLCFGAIFAITLSFLKRRAS